MMTGTHPSRNSARKLFSTDEAIERYTRRMEDPSLFPQERKAIDRYFTEPGASVLDVGCGAGRVSSILADRGFDVTGIDISEALVDQARSLSPGVEFHVGDITDTDFETQSFQYVVFSWFGLDYLTPESKRIQALSEINRVLKPSGVLVFSTHNSWYPIVPTSVRSFARGMKDVFDLYLRAKNRGRIGSRCKIERVPLGDVEIYLSNPIHTKSQLRKCGFTPLDVIGKRDGALRFFERDPHFVAKK